MSNQTPAIAGSTAGAAGGQGGVQSQFQKNPFLRGMFGLTVLLLLALPSFATTSVTGHVVDLGTGASTSGTFVRFTLAGCGGNQPTVPGVGAIAPTQGAVYFKDFAADGSGNVSGTLFSTRDSTGSLGGDISCGSSFTSVWYNMTIWVGGKSGPSVPVHAKNGVPLVVQTVTALTVNPVVTAPTGDSTYCRLDGSTGLCPAGASSSLTGPGSISGNFSGGPTLSGAWTFNGATALNGGGTFAGSWAGTPTLTGLWLFNPSVGTPAIQVGSTGMQWSQPSGGWSMDGRPNNNATRGEIRLSCNDTGGVDVSCGELTLLNKDLTGASFLAGNKSYMTFFYANSDNRWHTQINAFGTDTLKPWCIDPLAGTFTFCFYNSLTGSIGIGGGISKAGVPGIGAGVTHQRAASCTTGAAAGSVCTTMVTWVTGFVDTNYTVTCGVETPTAGVPYFVNLTKATGSVTVTIANVTAVAAAGTVDCIAMHD